MPSIYDFAFVVSKHARSKGSALMEALPEPGLRQITLLLHLRQALTSVIFE